MKILVTGGAGFIGSHIADRYVELGHEVSIVDNLSSGKIENLNPLSSFYQMDVQDEQVEEVFIKEKPEVINHHAAQIDVRKSVDDPVFDAKVNILGIIRLLHLSAKYGVKKFIFASSGGVVYGEPEYLPVDLSHKINPLSPYGVSKVSSEYYLNAFAALHGIKTVVLRYGNVYGPRQDPHGEAGVVAIFSNRLLNGQDLIVFGDGEQVRDYVFVGDVAEANVLALDCENSSCVVNVGTSIGTSVNELSNKIRKVSGIDAQVEYKPPRLGELEKTFLKNEDNALGWSPKIGIEEGLKMTFNYFKDSRSLGFK